MEKPKSLPAPLCGTFALFYLMTATVLVVVLQKSHPGLDMDTAQLNILAPSAMINKTSIWTQSTECYKVRESSKYQNTPNNNLHCPVPCPLVKKADIASSTMKITVDSRYSIRWILKNETNAVCAQAVFKFSEFGDYLINLTSNQPCKISAMTRPANSNFSLLYAFVIFGALAIIYYLSGFSYRKCSVEGNKLHPSNIQMNDTASNKPVQEDSSPKKPARKRLKFLDAFRGFCIIVMCFVNYGGGGYWYLDHSIWNGLHFADLVFPWFMFIMGTSMALSFESLSRRQTPLLEVLYKVLRRSVILFGLGVLLANRYSNTWQTLRIPGVLQKFGVAYLVVGVLHSLTVVPKDIIARKQREVLQLNGKDHFVHAYCNPSCIAPLMYSPRRV